MTAARNVADRLRADWEREKLALDEAVQYAAETKTSLPPNYWQAEWAARQRLRTAELLVEAMAPD